MFDFLLQVIHKKDTVKMRILHKDTRHKATHNKDIRNNSTPHSTPHSTPPLLRSSKNKAVVA